MSVILIIREDNSEDGPSDEVMIGGYRAYCSPIRNMFPVRARRSNPAPIRLVITTHTDSHGHSWVLLGRDILASACFNFHEAGQAYQPARREIRLTGSLASLVAGSRYRYCIR